MHGMHNLLIKNRTLHENTWKSFKLHPNLEEEHNNRSVLIKKKYYKRQSYKHRWGQRRPEHERSHNNPNSKYHSRNTTTVKWPEIKEGEPRESLETGCK